MATHTVKFTLPERELGKADITFAVKKDAEKFGELKISNGSAVWFPKNGKQGYRVGWTKLEEFFKESGVKVEKR
ncbi:Uncharacterised protein [Burkholderia pseudomallei]|uniref:hypothetical protein n=1 Tax=Burkholderia pseudomallei TaxID=28450 RepID=UPI00050EFA8F|nr:hypothetical protein [Burkholderia pseudomallei]KGC30585.1 hypothetical protein DO62_1684 [Burkholderia pseudomallei]KGX64849.1 hypothetical protein Y025_1899 [Burkholderia pseudomallei TSV32]CAJ2964276.1 Uncharacterised protein [Burkholderia pseudomallei]CAJ3815798.1 Uncharacterised protein [Burkholderia pseudomallei]CAJ4311648.1 Uncharacterised protein [Burkholderia pseudomallei]